MTSHQDDVSAFFEARGFGQRIGFGERPALLVIDLIRAFTDPDLPLGAKLDDQIAATTVLLDSARRHSLPVLFTTVFYEDPDLRDAGLWAIKQKGVASLRAGTPEVEVDPRLDRRDGREQLIVKKYASAFFGTDLISRLNAVRVDTVLLAGCTTSGCVRATAVDGLQNAFRVAVVREAVGDRARSAHEQSLFDLHAKYADVVALDEAVAYMEGIQQCPPG